MTLAWTGAADALLSQYVDDEGKVDYDALMDDPRLGSTAAAIAEQDPADFASAAEEKAFWINAYNIAALVLVARWAERRGGLPREGLTGLWAKSRFFFVDRVRVARRRRTLFGLEHLTIRRKYSDPRIHFALVCATGSCPPLRDGLFRGERLEEDLERAAEAFLRPGVGYEIDREAGVVKANRIFQWYRYDFRPVGGVEGAILRWGPEDDADWVRRAEPDVRLMDYDWSLNAP